MTEERRSGEDRRQCSCRREADAEALRSAIAGRIKVAMTRQHMSARTLATRAGLTDVTVGNVLEGKNAKLDTLLAIAYALDLNLPDLFTPRNANLN